eukprot:jgi/Undpi1/7956/HiC_scaffold_24.g10428.m1
MFAVFSAALQTIAPGAAGPVGDGPARVPLAGSTMARGQQDRLARGRRVTLSRVVSASLILSTTASCLVLNRSGLSDLALGRMSVAFVALFWFWSTFTEVFKRDTGRVCNGISFLCFALWSFSHIVWHSTSSEASSNSTTATTTTTSSSAGGTADAAPAWVWVDIAVAWAVAPLTGGSLELSLWWSVIPSWACVTVALGYGLRAEEVALGEGDAGGVIGLITAIAGFAVFGVSILAIGYQDKVSAEDERRRQASFSELLLRHLVTDPSLKVLGAGVKELFKDSRIFVMHSDALEQIQDGVSMLVDYGEKALDRLRNGDPELPAPTLESADMEEILDACLRTTAYLAVSRDHHKVQLDMRVSADVNKHVRTFRLWLSQMTRACLIHALHPDENGKVILRVSFPRPGYLRVGVEAVWRAAGVQGGGGGEEGGGGGAPRFLSGWDRDMPAAAWWVRAAALALGGEADYDRSPDRPGSNELWFAIPAENISDEEAEAVANTNQSATGAEPENGTATAIDGALGEWGGGPGLERGSSRKLPQMGGAGGPGLAPGGSHGGGRGGEKSGTIGPSVGEGTASLLMAPVKRAPTLTPLALGHEMHEQNPLTSPSPLSPPAPSPLPLPSHIPHEDVVGNKSNNLATATTTATTAAGPSGATGVTVKQGEPSPVIPKAGISPARNIQVSGVSYKKGVSSPPPTTTTTTTTANSGKPLGTPSPVTVGVSSAPSDGQRTSPAVNERGAHETSDGLNKFKVTLQDNNSVSGGREGEAVTGKTRGGRGGGADGKRGGGGRLGDDSGREAKSASVSAAAMSKKMSAPASLVQTLVEKNSWLGTTKSAASPVGSDAESEREPQVGPPKLKILLVDPQGLIRWAVPFLKERNFGVTVACSAEEAMSMMVPGAFQVIVVDLHMPRMPGTDFCRAVRLRDCQAQGGGGGVAGAGEMAGVPPADCTKLLLHTTAAGSVKSDDLEAFLEEGLVEKYVPHPLEITTLFDFLKLCEDGDDQYGTRKLSALLDGEAYPRKKQSSEAPGGAGLAPAAARFVRTMTDTISRNPRNAAEDDTTALGRERREDAARGSKWWFGSRTPPPPTVQDVASTFFSVRGKEGAGAAVRVEVGDPGRHKGGSHAAAGSAAAKGVSSPASPAGTGKQERSGGGGVSRQAPSSKTAGPWRPGPAAVSPGLGYEESGGYGR